MSNFEFSNIVTDMKRKYGISDEDTTRILISFMNASANNTNGPIGNGLNSFNNPNGPNGSNSSANNNPEPVKQVENKTVNKPTTAKKTSTNMKSSRTSIPCKAILRLGGRKGEECGQPSMAANEDGTPFEPKKEVCSRHKTYFLNESSSVKTVGSKAQNASKMTKITGATSNMFTNMVDMSTLDKNDQYVGSTALTDPVKNRLGLSAIPGYNEYSEDVTKLVFKYIEGSDVPICFARIPDLDHKDQILPLDAKSISICQAKIIKYEEDPNPQLTRKSFNSVPFTGTDPVPTSQNINVRNSVNNFPSFGNFDGRISVLPARNSPGPDQLVNSGSVSVIPARTTPGRSSVLPARNSPLVNSGSVSVLPARTTPGRTSMADFGDFNPQPIAGQSIANQSITNQFGNLAFGENPFGADMSSLARASVQYGQVRMSPAANQFQ